MSLRFSIRSTLIISVVVLLAACQKKEEASKAEAPPPSAIGVITVKPETLPITNELPGRVAPTRLAEVRPRVSGIVVQRVFEQGSLVKQGDVLYQIDPAPFEALVASAEGTLKRAQAGQLQARQNSERQQQLRRSNVASQQEFDNAVALLAQADADVTIAQAGLTTARLNLDYASIRAPISGRIGRALITEGALVSQNGTENLATIQQLDPIYADFTQPAADLIRLRKALEQGQSMSGDGQAPVRLVLDDGTDYDQPGKLLFSEAAVDEGTGQVTLRGEFPNPNNDLLPGMYVRVKIEQGIERSALAVPQQAVQRDAGGQANVLVVNKDSKIEQKRVTVGRIVGDRFVISKGLKEGDEVVAEGFQKVAPGATVKAEPWVSPREKDSDEQPAGTQTAKQTSNTAQQ